jgi:hypothetical protein
MKKPSGKQNGRSNKKSMIDEKTVMDFFIEWGSENADWTNKGDCPLSCEKLSWGKRE